MKWHEMDVLGRALIIAYGGAFVLGLIAGLLLTWLVGTNIGVPVLCATSVISLCCIACVYFAEWYLERDCIRISSKKDTRG